MASRRMRKKSEKAYDVISQLAVAKKRNSVAQRMVAAASESNGGDGDVSEAKMAWRSINRSERHHQRQQRQST